MIDNVCLCIWEAYVGFIDSKARNFKVLTVCKADMRQVLTFCNPLPNLETIEIPKTCPHHNYFINMENVKMEKFPLLTRIVYGVSGKDVFEPHKENEYVSNGDVFYKLCRNRDKIECAKTLFWCIRKTFAGLDKNVVKKICREYVMLPYEMYCKEEMKLREKFWNRSELLKQKTYLDRQREKNARTREILTVERKKLSKRLRNLDDKLDQAELSVQSFDLQHAQIDLKLKFVNQ